MSATQERSDLQSVMRWYDGMNRADADYAVSEFADDCKWWANELTPEGLKRYWLEGKMIIGEYLKENCTDAKPGTLKYTPLNVAVAGHTIMIENTMEAHYQKGGGFIYRNIGVFIFQCDDEHHIVEVRPYYEPGPVEERRRTTGWTGGMRE